MAILQGPTRFLSEARICCRTTEWTQRETSSTLTIVCFTLWHNFLSIIRSCSWESLSLTQKLIYRFSTKSDAARIGCSRGGISPSYLTIQLGTGCAKILRKG